MFELSGVNYEEVLEKGDSILIRVIASSSYRVFELSGLSCIYTRQNQSSLFVLRALFKFLNCCLKWFRVFSSFEKKNREELHLLKYEDQIFNFAETCKESERRKPSDINTRNVTHMEHLKHIFKEAVDILSFRLVWVLKYLQIVQVYFVRKWRRKAGYR